MRVKNVGSIQRIVTKVTSSLKLNLRQWSGHVFVGGSKELRHALAKSSGIAIGCTQVPPFPKIKDLRGQLPAGFCHARGQAVERFGC